MEVSKISEKGSALAIDAVCKAGKPPLINKVMATTPVEDAQKTRCHSGVSVRPPEASISNTSEPESAEVTKNKITKHMPTKKATKKKETASKREKRPKK